MSDLILGGVLGLVLGMWLFYLAMKIVIHMAIRRAGQELQDLEQALSQLRESGMIACRVELHENQYFVYNNDTNEFMAQGNTLAELRDRIRARWSDRRVSVVAGDETALEQLKAQLDESSSSK